MKAVIRTIAATKHGVEGQIQISIDAFGPVMEFVASGAESSVFTSDDAMVADSFVASTVNLRDAWNKVNETEYVFEAGIEIAYDGVYNTRLFKSFKSAEAHATQVGIDDGEWGTPYIRAVELEG